MAQKMKSLFNWISGMKLRYRMLIVYIIGGALPIITSGLYLVHGMSSILIEQAKNAEGIELEMAKNQVEEIASTVSTVTKYFYFDAQLEEIATKQYENYREVVEDYKDFTSFLDYGRYYNSTLAWINIYVKNAITIYKFVYLCSTKVPPIVTPLHTLPSPPELELVEAERFQELL